MKNSVFKKGVALLALTGLLAAAPLTAAVSAAPVEAEVSNDIEIHSSPTYMADPVLLKYMAKENGCRLLSDEDGQTVSIIASDGTILKTYYQIPYLFHEAVISAQTLEADLGWSACRHLPDVDMFDTESEAIIAGWLTFLRQNTLEDAVLYTGQCYTGFYFSYEKGAHAAGCPYTAAAAPYHQEQPFTISGGTITEGVPSDLSQWLDGKSIALVMPELTYMDLFHLGAKPVLIQYITRKNQGTMLEHPEDNKVTLYNKDGQILAHYWNLPVIFGIPTIEAGILSGATWDDALHLPDTDMFDTAFDATLAGWLTYMGENQNTTFYTGSCFQGHYFSANKGDHAALCPYEKVLDHMHQDVPVNITGGFLEDDAMPGVEEQKAQLNAYVNYKQLREARPDNAMTKMVTVFYTEYASSNTQSTYFSYRDRIYRNYWKDLAYYDVTDYIFIPPDIPGYENPEAITSLNEGIQYYKDLNDHTANTMAAAVNELLVYRPDAKIWIGTPGVSAMNFSNEAINAPVLTDFLRKVKWALGDTIWEENVTGVYINQESLYGDEAQVQEQITRFQAVVGDFKNAYPGKKSLWIPYYDQSAEKIARVSLIPDLFDYIVIQPGYFFVGANPEDSEYKKPYVAAVMQSALLNKVVGEDGKPIFDEEAQTIIGFEVESQASYFSSSRATRSNSIQRYTDYLAAAAQIKETSPIVYYVSGDAHVNLEHLAYKFYEAGMLGYDTVKKKLDVDLNQFFDYIFQTRDTDSYFADYAKELYLSADPTLTEEDFTAAYKADVIIPEFYRHEKNYNIGDIVTYTLEKSYPLHFNNRILHLLGVEGY